MSTLEIRKKDERTTWRKTLTTAKDSTSLTLNGKQNWNVHSQKHLNTLQKNVWYELCLALLLKSPLHVFVVKWGMVRPVPHRVSQNTFNHPNFVSLSGLKAFWLKKRRIRPRIFSVHNNWGDLFNVAAGDGLIVSANLSLIPPESDTPEIVDDGRLLSS